VDVEDVVLAQVGAQLADGLQEGLALDVAHGAADLDDGHVLVLGHAQDGALDLVGDVGDHLDGAAQVVAAALLLDDGVVDAPGGEVVVLAHGQAQVALVVAQIQVGLGPVVGDVDLAVLERVHGARIDVDVGVELLDGHPKAPGLEERAYGGGGQTLAQRGENPSRDENELGLHTALPPWNRQKCKTPARLTHRAGARI